MTGSWWDDCLYDCILLASFVVQPFFWSALSEGEKVWTAVLQYFHPVYCCHGSQHAWNHERNKTPGGLCAGIQVVFLKSPLLTWARVRNRVCARMRVCVCVLVRVPQICGKIPRTFSLACTHMTEEGRKERRKKVWKGGKSLDKSRRVEWTGLGKWDDWIQPVHVLLCSKPYSPPFLLSSSLHWSCALLPDPPPPSLLELKTREVSFSSIRKWRDCFDCSAH